MPSVMGHVTNAIAQPVRYTGGTGGSFENQPTSGSWINDGAAVDIVKLPLGREERTRAGIDVDPEAYEIYFNLPVTGTASITTRKTVAIGGKRYNVLAVEPYDYPGYNVGIAQIVRL